MRLTRKMFSGNGMPLHASAAVTGPASPYDVTKPERAVRLIEAVAGVTGLITAHALITCARVHPSIGRAVHWTGRVPTIYELPMPSAATGHSVHANT